MTSQDLTRLTGADCFVHGMVLNGDGSGTHLEDVDTIDNALWLHLDYSHDDCETTLKSLGVPNNAVESLLRINTRPRTMISPDGVMLFLRAINLNPGDDPDDMVSLRIWMEKSRLITIRQRRIFSIQDLRQELEQGRGPSNVQDLLLAIVEKLADRISEYVDHIEDKVGEFEEAVETGNSNEVRVQVSSFRRQAAGVRRYLAPQRDALDSFYRQSRDFLNERNSFELHEQTDRIIRYVEDLDLVRERCLVLQEELLNRIAQEQNARMYVLSIVAAVFLPISFVTGLFGMNVAGLPGLEQPRAFLLVAGSMAVIVAGILAYFRTRKWF